MQTIRDGVINCDDHMGIDYIEAEYCPRSFVKVTNLPSRHGSQERGNRTRLRKDKASHDIEMQRLTHRTSEGSMYSVASGWESP
jgi:hypothetical protein